MFFLNIKHSFFLSINMFSQLTLTKNIIDDCHPWNKPLNSVFFVTSMTVPLLWQIVVASLLIVFLVPFECFSHWLFMPVLFAYFYTIALTNATDICSFLENISFCTVFCIFYHLDNSWYILKSFIKFFLQIQNIIRLS